MKIIKLLLTISWFLTTASFATDISRLNPIKAFDVNSTLTSAPISYYATLPASYDKAPQKRYVLLFDIHPRSQPLHAGMHDWMSHNGAWPWIETIIVTPQGYDANFRALYSAYLEGKNNDFVNYIANDLLPSIARQFRLNGFKIYSGFTGNAAAGLALLLDQPELFNAYILASPVLKDHPLNFAEKVKRQLPKISGKPRYVMLSTSDSGYEQAQLASFESITALVKSLAPEQLQVSVKRFDGSYYMTQPVLATSHAIEEIFNDAHQNIAPDSALAKQGTQAIIDYYQFLSTQKYGFEVSAQPSLKSLGHSLLATQPEQAIEVLKKAVELYPESAFAYDALAFAYHQQGLAEQAISMQQQAVKHSTKLVEYWQRKHQKTLTNYQNTLNINSESR